MSDSNFNNSSNQYPEPASSSTTSTTSKPKLSLFSSKQSGIRLKSEDQPDHQITILSNNLIINNNAKLADDAQSSINISTEMAENEPDQIVSGQQQKESQQQIHTQQPQATENDSNRMNISREDLIRLLSMLKSELQSKEIALAAIKCEQLKRLINPVEISRSSLANTYIQLQDRLNEHDQNNNNIESELSHDKPQPSSASTKTNQRKSLNQLDNIEIGKPKRANLSSTKDEADRECLNILNTLLELLDRHPLLALPRDSIYCLDYNCNELSTKNYLNLKIQHLDNLISQHRRYRYYMNERLKKSEQRYLDLTHQLELERLLKSEIEKSAYKATGKAILLKHIDQLKEDLEKEKNDKQVIVMTLLNELLDERERVKELTSKLADLEKSEMTSGERRKLLNLEDEVTDLSMQLVKNNSTFAREKAEFESRVASLELENSNLKIELEKRDKTTSSVTNRISNSSKVKEIQIGNQHAAAARNPIESAQNPTRQVISSDKQQSGSSNPSLASRGAVGGAKSSSPPISKSTSVNVVNSSPSHKIVGTSASADTNSTAQSSNIAPLKSPVSASTTSSIYHRSNAPQTTSKLLGGGSMESTVAPIRVQPLFKSASVLSTHQQVKNLKNPTNTTNSTSSPSRVPSNSQSVTKPRVPAKPAQLLDQQRNSIN